jgi:hypothetical protein
MFIQETLAVYSLFLAQTPSVLMKDSALKSGTGLEEIMIVHVEFTISRIQ